MYVREMIGVIQLKKYRAMKQRYDSKGIDEDLRRRLEELEEKSNEST
jgi:hypothetical protein